jgi:hypothetical protein
VEWWKSIAPAELDIDWLDPGAATKVAAAGAIAFSKQDLAAMYKMLANLAHTRRLPFTKAGKGKTSARLYSLATCIRLRFVYELSRTSGFNEALLKESDAVCDWFFEQLGLVMDDFSERRRVPSRYTETFLLSRPNPDRTHTYIIGSASDVASALAKDFRASLCMTISDIGCFLGAIAKEYVRVRMQIVSQRAQAAQPLLEGSIITVDEMRAFLRYSAKRGVTLGERRR